MCYTQTANHYYGPHPDGTDTLVALYYRSHAVVFLHHYPSKRAEQVPDQCWFLDKPSARNIDWFIYKTLQKINFKHKKCQTVETRKKEGSFKGFYSP